MYLSAGFLIYQIQYLTNNLSLSNLSMSDNEATDETFEKTESGASATYPTQAGNLKKGGYAMLGGFPCKVRISSNIPHFH